jgi:hypothetical protein
VALVFKFKRKIVVLLTILLIGIPMVPPHMDLQNLKIKLMKLRNFGSCAALSVSITFEWG